MAEQNEKAQEQPAGGVTGRLRALFSRGLSPDRDHRGDREGIEALTAADIASAVPDPLIIFDPDGTILLANAAARRAFGVDTGVSLHLKFRSPEMHELVRAALEEPGRPHTIEYSERVPFERVYRVTASRIGSGEGAHILVFEDQSEAHRIDRMRADFIANASHELRTPLASIAGFIETLRGSARDDAKARERFLQIMQNQTERMARLIDDLLSLSRLEIKPYLKPATEVDIVALLHAVADSMAHIAAEAGVAIERELPAAEIRVAGNHDELVQVFDNLIENACKYGASGGRIIVSARAEPEGGAVVTVRDFGPGIPEEHIPRITERFYRVDIETSRAQKGTGLGLSIVKHILTRHDATLRIESKLGEGSAFIVRFPPV